MRHLWLAFVLVPFLVAQDPARLDAARITRGEFAAQRFGPARWLDDAHYATLEPKAGTGALELVRYDTASGAREVLIPAHSLRASGHDKPLLIEDYAVSPNGREYLIFCDSERVWRTNTRGEYFLVRPDSAAQPERVGGKLPKSSLMHAKYSPDGKRIAFVSGNNLFVQDSWNGEPVALTQDGSRTVINGTFDWVYEEEYFLHDGFRWSPDGQSIAYWQLDCSGVGEFLMIDDLSDRYSKVVPVQFPMAGTTNSSCRIGVVPVKGGPTVWMKTEGDPRETYLARMEWHPGGKELMVQWQNREQNELKVLGCEVATGAVRVVHEEMDTAYLDVRDDFRWLRGGEAFFWSTDAFVGVVDPGKWRLAMTFLWNAKATAEREKKTQAPWVDNFTEDNSPDLLTLGFDLMGVDHADLDHGKLYVSGCDGNPTQKYLFAVETGKATRLSPKDQPGWHDYQVSPGGTIAIHTYSRFATPPVIDLVRLPSHERVRTLVDNQPLRDKVAALQKGKDEFFRVKVDDGLELDGWAMYPPDFDANKSWPVVFHVYGEPWDQTVKDTWFLPHHLFHRWLTQQGYVVMSIDNRGTPAPRGRDFRKALHQQIGVASSRDWDQAVRALCAQHSWMDKSRLAIWGWSGGGSMTLNLLFRYPDLFAAGMSVAPLTDLTLYDTIYAERYSGDPRQVPEVYRECSPITYAKNLKGHLLLVHGTGDDNVHFQNSERLIDALVEHGKLFELLAYPNRTHAIVEGKGTRQHLYASLADFLQRRLPAGAK